MTAEHIILGRNGEEAACAYLRSKKMRIIARNWRYRGCELDIVCEFEENIIFIEVKTRTHHAAGNAPEELLKPLKRNRVAKAAYAFLSEMNLWDRPCRFDLIAALPVDEGFRIEHLENAFDMNSPQGCVKDTWQPW